MNTKTQLFRDPGVEPTEAAIARGLGAANDTYTTFTEGLKRRDIDLEYRYYPDGKAWLGKGLYRWTGVRGGRKEATVFWLSLWDGFFKVTVYIPEKCRSDALALPVGDAVREMIEASTQMGKLKFFPLVFDLDSEELLEAVYTLIDFRKAIK